MWMGPVAFRFYMPALIAYVKSPDATGDSDIVNCVAGTLELRLEWEPEEMRKVARELKDFCEYVLRDWEKSEIDLNIYCGTSQDLEKLGLDPEKILPAWHFDLRTRFEKLCERFESLI